MVTNENIRDHMIRLVKNKWTAKGQTNIVSYLQAHVFIHKFSRCDDAPGKPMTTNTHERMNLALKDENHFNSVEGMCTVLKRSLIVGYRFGRDTPDLALAPIGDAHPFILNPP